uniref:Ig-like domain-containing protein n=1 Tax=Cyprinus carpio TaxID=7962 RepID=A0A8C2HFZ6_CYPCA
MVEKCFSYINGINFLYLPVSYFPVICKQDWQVQYSSMMKCALKGSTIHLSSSYKHPNYLTVTERFWTVNPNKDESINLLNRPNYRDRVQYFPDKEQTFVLKLSNVTHEDEGMYCLRILTDVEKQKYLGFPGIDLKVTELRVEIPEEVVEGESSVLVCKTTCNLSDKTNFTWYKNSKSLSESIDSYQLLLQSVSSDDSGNYSCAVRDQKHLLSPAVTLSVRYPPKNVSVSISPSGEIVEGDSVTLSCSSDSNPPALNFRWFKENQSSAVGSGQSFIISSFNSSHSGSYYCEAQNKHGSQRSASVSVTSAGINMILKALSKLCWLQNLQKQPIQMTYRELEMKTRFSTPLSSTTETPETRLRRPDVSMETLLLPGETHSFI